MRDTSDTVRLPIHRVTAVGTQRTDWHLTVSCPARGSVVSDEACAACAQLHALLPPDEDGRSYVVCAPPITAGPGLVKDIMTHDVFCVRPELPAPNVLVLLQEKSFASCPVVDDAGRPLGIVRTADVTRREGHGVTARALMSPVHEIEDWRRIPEAAAAMARERVHEVAVVNAEGKLVGLLSAVDVLRWLGGVDVRVEEGAR
jgi:CBS domain-containing protein